MDSSKQISNVALFPLCDVHGILTGTLSEVTDKRGTRADALMMAWRVSLPDRIDIKSAADAVLLVAMSTSRNSWSERQLLILDELMVLAGREVAVPRVARLHQNKIHDPAPKRRTRDMSGNRMSRRESTQPDSVSLPPAPNDPSAANSTAKQSKKWWRLVGRDTEGSL